MILASQVVDHYSLLQKARRHNDWFSEFSKTFETEPDANALADVIYGFPPELVAPVAKEIQRCVMVYWQAQRDKLREECIRLGIDGECVDYSSPKLSNETRLTIRNNSTNAAS